MPRVRIGAAYKTGNITGVALLQEGNKVVLQVFQAQSEGATCAPTTAIIVENASSLVYAGEQTSNIFTCAEQVRILVQEMREGVQAFDVIIVITREAIQVTLARKYRCSTRRPHFLRPSPRGRRDCRVHKDIRWAPNQDLPQKPLHHDPLPHLLYKSIFGLAWSARPLTRAPLLRPLGRPTSFAPPPSLPPPPPDARRQSGAPSGTLSRLTALFAAQLRRAWGVTAVREMARHRLARIPLIGATRGTRLAQVFAPLAYAAASHPPHTLPRAWMPPRLRLGEALACPSRLSPSAPLSPGFLSRLSS
eukprot:scaffold2702_cov116-Isochrysis_galbana.AAC.12